MILHSGQNSIDYVTRRETWTKCFAWLPVSIVGTNPRIQVWWDYVERKSIQIYAGMDDGWPWSTFYRRIGENVDVKLDPSNRWAHVVVKPEPTNE